MIQTNSGKTAAADTVGKSLGHVAHDIMTLAELQVRLLQIDFRAATARWIRPCAVFAAGVVLLLATLPVCLSPLQWPWSLPVWHRLRHMPWSPWQASRLLLPWHSGPGGNFE